MRQTRPAALLFFWAAGPDLSPREILNSMAPFGPATGESSYASSKTWYKAASQAQEAAEARQGLLPDQGKALPVGKGSGEPLAAVHLSRPPDTQARLPHAVDSAHRSRRAQQRHHLQPVDSWAEGGRH